MHRPNVTTAGVSCAVVLVLDQVTKTVAGIQARNKPSGLLVPVRNRSLSLELVHASRWAEVSIMLIGLAVAGLVLNRAVALHRIPAWAAGAILGGSAGNVLDRVRSGSVRDFLALGRFAVINLADVAVLVGVAACLYAATRTRPHPKPAEGGDHHDEPAATIHHAVRVDPAR